MSGWKQLTEQVPSKKSSNFLFDGNSRSCGWSLFLSPEQMSEFLNSTSLSICCRLPYLVRLVGSTSPQTTTHRWTVSNFNDRFESSITGDSWKSNRFPVNGLKNVEFKLSLYPKNETENHCALHLETSFLAVYSTVRVHFELWIQNTKERLHKIAYIHDFVSINSCGTPIYLEQKQLREFASNAPLVICCNIRPLLDGTTGVSKWKAYHQEIASLFNDINFSDIKIEVENRTFYVSKAIVSAKSSVFRSMFSNSMDEQKTEIVKINDFKAPIIETLLNFIYTDEVNNLNEIASDLLPVAKHYKVKSLVSRIQTLNSTTRPSTSNSDSFCSSEQVEEQLTVDDQMESQKDLEDLENKKQNYNLDVNQTGNRRSISPTLRGVPNALFKFIPGLISSITKTNESSDDIVSTTSEDAHQEISLPIPSTTTEESSTHQPIANHQNSAENSESETSKIVLVMNELLTTERTYTDILKSIDEFYYSPFIDPENQQLIPDTFCGQSDVIFGNVYELRQLHCDEVLPMFDITVSSPLQLCRFLMNVRDRLLGPYCKFSESRRMFDSFLQKDQIDCCQFFVNCQKRAGDILPLSFHLLKPIQRLGQYPLLLQQLHSYAIKENESEEVCREIQKALDAMTDLITKVNFAYDTHDCYQKNE
ncbi:hypothetical protein M3Y94_00665200 [Aphelenchoides besseyi]|nr:hypothetical protein M3Y94_00665200 [Aphelenchoides besseyi]